MTSISIQASRTRAGLLVLALALVGGTGCITSAIVQNVQQQNRMREWDQARESRIKILTPLAEKGDAKAAVALAGELLNARDESQVDQDRVLALLSMAASKDNGPAQGMLGEILVEGTIPMSGYRHLALAPGYQDRERGLQLLRQAATQGCIYASVSNGYWPAEVAPALTVGRALERAGRNDEGWLWRARAAHYCGQPGIDVLTRQITSPKATSQQRIQSLALMLLLPQEGVPIAQAEAAMPAAEVGEGQREAQRLRQLVSQSEQQYPPPKRKTIQ
jgi:hypothetical protein